VPGREGLKYLLRQLKCAARLRHWYQAIHPCVPVRLGSRSKATVASGSIALVKVKVMAFEEHAKPRSYTNRGNDRRPGSERQKAT